MIDEALFLFLSSVSKHMLEEEEEAATR